MEKNSKAKPHGSTLAESLVYSTLLRVARSPASISELTKSTGFFPEEIRQKERTALLEPLLHRMVDVGYVRTIPAPNDESALETYSITRKGLGGLEAIVRSRLPERPAFPRVTPLGGSPLGEVFSPLELSQGRVRVARELLGAGRAGETAAQRERALRAYAIATGRELDWTVRLQRRTSASALRSRSRIG